jgi:hypothetical protein
MGRCFSLEASSSMGPCATASWMNGDGVNGDARRLMVRGATSRWMLAMGLFPVFNGNANFCRGLTIRV